MTKNQIYNIFLFVAIIVLDDLIINHSPDYLKEKSLCFFNKIGKNKFIENVDFNKNYWIAYCKKWKQNQDDYELMNIIFFLTSFTLGYSNSIFRNFEKYIGGLENISDSDLKYKDTPLILKYLIDNNIFNSRFLKLMSLS